MSNTGIILTLAYPETIVMHADEWYSPYLKYIGIGNKTHVRAGHAAMVLISKVTGVLEYHDFGRYITPKPNGRVRGKDTDNELDFPLKAEIKDDRVVNLEAILKFLATNPKLTHGDGTLYASVCNTVNYDLAREHITEMQNKHFIRYAAFINNACNCARFVTDALIASITDPKIRKRLINSQWFTPSTVGNVVLADTENYIYQVDEVGNIQEFNSTISRLNRRLFLDKLKQHNPNSIGTIEPKPVDIMQHHAQWLSGIAAGAWFELYNKEQLEEYLFRRISPYGNIDVEAVFVVEDVTFDYYQPYEFIHYSNCQFFHIQQKGKVFRFDRKS
jgi:hypothetical protein